jgi:hypothetical protein
MLFDDEIDSEWAGQGVVRVCCNARKWAATPYNGSIQTEMDRCGDKDSLRA